MKKHMLALLLACVLVLGIFPVTAGAADTAEELIGIQAEADNLGEFMAQTKVEGVFRQSEARSILNMINDFRTGSEAWFWNPNNQTKTVYNTSGSYLSELTYDYALEQIAIQRAMEIAVSFSHTRPNGESCFSCTYDGVRSYGENIAMGYPTAESVFSGWREDNDNYAGQGHRRNMLREGYEAVGIACFVYGGYCYWVQEFGYRNSGAEATEAIDEAAYGYVVMPAAGWVQNIETGKWMYIQNGAPLTGWQYIDDSWYVFDQTGEMRTGWVKDDGMWYYMDGSGAMQTGWVNDGGTWYYMSGGGVMQTGWLYDGGWYYLGGSGAMQTSWVSVDGVWYYMNGSGVMQTGWLNDGGTWYYLHDSGAMATGWLYDGGWYYLRSSGAMAAGETLTVDGVSYNFNGSGVWVS